MFGNNKKSRIADKVVALECLRTNIMMADNNLNITYLNESLIQLMTEAEAELRVRLIMFFKLIKGLRAFGS
jgi:hypothetical protein